MGFFHIIRNSLGRAKVEDDPENPQIVQTVRGIGYKFVTPEQ